MDTAPNLEHRFARPYALWELRLNKATHDLAPKYRPNWKELKRVPPAGMKQRAPRGDHVVAAVPCFAMNEPRSRAGGTAVKRVQKRLDSRHRNVLGHPSPVEPLLSRRSGRRKLWTQPVGAPKAESPLAWCAIRPEWPISRCRRRKECRYAATRADSDY